LTILNLNYKFNTLVNYIREINFEKKIKRKHKNIAFYKYPKWSRIFNVLNYFLNYLIDNELKNQYREFVNKFESNNELKIYYNKLINYV
jgi:hypothetical protein